MSLNTLSDVVVSVLIQHPLDDVSGRIEPRNTSRTQSRFPRRLEDYRRSCRWCGCGDGSIQSDTNWSRG